jgi:hypothetical protein
MIIHLPPTRKYQMTPWWFFLRELFVKNEFWHYPDLVLLYLIRDKYMRLKDPKESEKRAWLENLSAAQLLLDTGEPIPLQATKVSLPVVTDLAEIQEVLRRPNKSQNKILNPFGIKRPEISISFDAEYNPAVSAALKKLSQFRSYYNTGRMKIGRYRETIDGPAILSFGYILVPVNTSVFYISPSWNGSSQRKAPEATYTQLVASAMKNNIDDPRISPSSILDESDKIATALNLPQHCRMQVQALSAFNLDSRSQHPVPSEVFDIYVRLTSQPAAVASKS